MVVKNVLRYVAELLENSELAKYFLEENEASLDEEEVEKLLISINMAISNVSANYINVCARTKVKSDDGFIKFSQVSTLPIIQIKKVLKGGEPVKFRIHSDAIEVGRGEYEIVYSYFPNSVGIDDNITFFPQLNELTFAYEVVAEYLFLKGQIDDAYAWDKRFKASILSIQRPCRNVVLKKRRWW